MTRTAFILRAAMAAVLLAVLPPAARGGSVSGRVLDSSGKGIGGARVEWTAYRTDEEILLDQTAGNEPAGLGHTATDAEGRFRVVLDKPGVSVALRILPVGLPSARWTGPFE